jgi:hypothetical protein
MPDKIRMTLQSKHQTQTPNIKKFQTPGSTDIAPSCHRTTTRLGTGTLAREGPYQTLAHMRQSLVRSQDGYRLGVEGLLVFGVWYLVF